MFAGDMALSSFAAKLATKGAKAALLVWQHLWSALSTDMRTTSAIVVQGTSLLCHSPDALDASYSVS